MDTYKSISSPSEGLYKELGSRFISFAFPVETEEEVKAKLSEIRKEYHDARHVCHAFRLGLAGDLFRSSDDGEPSGTAGRPILGQLVSAGLCDVLIVVVRYFGGIKLGVPGLARAYKAAAASALEAAGIVIKTASERYMIRFGYLSMNAVMKAVKDLQLEQTGQDFGQNCSLDVRVRLSAVEDFEKRMENIEDCRIEKIE